MKAFFTITGVCIAVMWVIAKVWIPHSETEALFCLDEIAEPKALAMRMRNPETRLDAFLRDNLSVRTEQALKAYNGVSPPPEGLINPLVYDLNDLIQGKSIYTEERFEGVALSKATQEHLEETVLGVERSRLNRMLLEDAYPDIFRPASEKPPVTVLNWSTDPNPARQTQLAPFRAMHCDLNIDIEPVTYDKILVQCSSGVGPDIIEVYSNVEMIAYVSAGIMMDLTPYAKKYGFSPDVTYPQLRGNIVYNGRQYRFPCNVGNQVLIYNKKIFKEAGIPEPTDEMPWEDFVELVKPLTVKRDDGTGYKQFAMLIGRAYVDDIHLQFGGRFYSDDKTECVLDEPQSVRAMEFYRDLVIKYDIVPSPTQAKSLAGSGGWGTEELRWFASGRAAVMWGARWMMVQFRGFPDLNGNLGAVFLPKAPGAEHTACYCGTRGSGINVNSNKPQEALVFMQYLATDEYNRQIALDSDGLPPNMEFASDPENLVNPKYPWETAEFHKKFVDAMQYAKSPETSPFVDPLIVNKIWEDAVDIITNEIMTPEEAMIDATKKINDRIQNNIQERKDLRELYERIKAGEIDLAGK